MGQRFRTTVARMAAGCLVASAFLLLLPLSSATASPLPPHVVTGNKSTTDSCAICHRAHSATAAVPHTSANSTDLVGSALIASPETSLGDVPLCYSCHGTGQLGSDSDIETGFAQVSSHSMTPTVSPYGRGPKMCSTCHDSHGSERTASGTPYPALLRSFEGTTPVVTGEEYCATCHAARSDERWAGLPVFEQTGHFTAMPLPDSGTRIRCSICHAPHGSPVAPLLVSIVTSPAAPATRTITADDRTFCVACHPTPSATWSGETTYAASAHAQATTTVPIVTKWVPAGRQRVGECQVCHAAMGRSNGAGGAVPKLLDKSGRALCDDCHRSGGVASADTSSEAYPVPESDAVELVAAYPSGDQAPFAARVSVYGRALSGAQPRTLIGPRQYLPAAGVGPSASGDIDGDSNDELVVASPTEPLLTVYSRDPLTGLSSAPATSALPIGSDVAALKIANVVNTGILPLIPDRPEIVIVTTAGDLVFYHYPNSGSVLTTVAGPIPVGSGPWGLAVGDATGTPLPDAVVTDRPSAVLTIVTDDGSHGITATTATVGVEPVAPVVGDVWAGLAKSAIVVADADPATATVHVLDGGGGLLADYDVAGGGGVPVASAVGDVLWNEPPSGRDDLALSFADAAGDSTTVVIPQVTTGSGLATGSASSVSLGSGRHAATLLAGDVEGDGHAELVSGNAGTWATGSDAVAPSFAVVRADGSSVLSTRSYTAGGTEMAGRAPYLVLADFGPVLPSRHPIDEVGAGTHVSTETASAARHVTCADCHNSHEATDAVTAAPAVQGPLMGAWGVSVTYDLSGAHVTNETTRSPTSYGVCLKCHPAQADQFDPGNTSGHAVVTTSDPVPDIADTTFKSGSGLSASSVLYCSDCHANDGRSSSQARGPHTSASSPILVSPYVGVAPDSASLLCYDCHRRDVYATGAFGPTSSSFVRDQDGFNLHVKHVAAPADGGHGLSCAACHVSHGSASPHMLRDDIGFTEDTAHSGSCDNSCHSPDSTHTYGN